MAERSSFFDPPVLFSKDVINWLCLSPSTVSVKAGKRSIRLEHPGYRGWEATNEWASPAVVSIFKEGLPVGEARDRLWPRLLPTPSVLLH